MDALLEQLICHTVAGTSQDHRHLARLQASALRRLRDDRQGGSRKDWIDVQKSLNGLTRTARIRVQDDLADALSQVTNALGAKYREGSQGWEGDSSIKMSNLAEHIQFLLNLAKAPTLRTHSTANAYLNRAPAVLPDPDKELFDEIMSEPFRGAHWTTGYDDEIREGWTDSSDDDSSESSRSEEDVVTPQSRSALRAAHVERQRNEQQADAEARLAAAKETLRAFERDAYWKTGGERLQAPEGISGWREVSSRSTGLGLSTRPSLQRQAPKAISSSAFQRELLFALSGRPSLFIAKASDNFTFALSTDHPMVEQYSSEALTGLLADVRARCEHIEQLRLFVRSHDTSTDQIRHSKTAQAFASAVQTLLQDVSHYLASEEQRLLLGDSGQMPTSTPLSLLRSYDEKYHSIIDILAPLLPLAKSSVLLLNTLHSSLGITSGNTALRLFEVTLATLEPQWTLLSRWLDGGMPIPLALVNQDEIAPADHDNEAAFDPEFFLQRDKDVSWADEDFWESAWIIGNDGWPSFIGEDLRDSILEAGKAKGLLRGLMGLEGRCGQVGCLADIFAPLVDRLSEPNPDKVDIGREITSYLTIHLRPICELFIFQLRRSINDECGLYEHLVAIEGTMLACNRAVMDDWTKALFANLRSGNTSWADFQALTGSYRESISALGDLWMNSPAIRITLSARLKAKTGLDALGLVKADYQVPFPLSQLFSPTSIELRSEVFTFLLQLQYARYIADVTLNSAPCRGSSLTALTAIGNAIVRLRHRLIWLLSSIQAWIHDRVIAALTQAYRQDLGKTNSLRDMIRLELQHVRQIRTFCFLHDSTSVANGCVTTIMGICEALSRIAETVESLRTSEPRRLSPVSYIQGRTRQRVKRYERRAQHSDDEEDEPHTEAVPPKAAADAAGVENSASPSADVDDHLRKLHDELDRVIVVLGEEVAQLARSTETDGLGDTAENTWEMLSFAMEGLNPS